MARLQNLWYSSYCLTKPSMVPYHWPCCLELVVAGIQQRLEAWRFPIFDVGYN